MKKIRQRYSKDDLIRLEREVLGFNMTSIMGDSGLKILKNGFLGVTDALALIESGENKKGFVFAGVISEVTPARSKAGNNFYWISISDDFSSIKVYCKDTVFLELSSQMLISRCSLIKIDISNGFISISNCRLMSNVQFADGYILVARVDPKAWSYSVRDYILDNIGISIRTGNVELYYNSIPMGIFVDPTTDLIDELKSKLGIKCEVLNKEEFLWGNFNKYLNNYERDESLGDI